MKFLCDQFYVEVKDNRYIIHPTSKIISRKRDPPQSLKTQHQVRNGTQIRKKSERY